MWSDLTCFFFNTYEKHTLLAMNIVCWGTGLQLSATSWIFSQTTRLCRPSSRCSIGLYPSNNGRCSQIIKNPKSEYPDIWIRLPRHKWPKSRSSMEDPVVRLERNLHGHPLAGLLWERQFENIPFAAQLGKVPNWECFFVHRE